MARLIDCPLSVGLATFDKLVRQGEFTDELAEAVRKDPARAVAALNSEFFSLHPYRGSSPGQSTAADVTSSSIVVVPDMAAVDLTALVEKELDLTHLDSDYRRWDYYRGNDGAEISGRGRKYEVLIWKPELAPDETISSKIVSDHFKELKAFGHAGAFTQWRRVCGLDGYHATILEDNACCRNAGGNLCVPYSNFGDGLRGLSQDWIGGVWSDGWSFVGFRELP